MRTTIDLPDPLFRELKAYAALRGSSLKKVITQTLEARLRSQAKPPRVRKRVRLPLVPSKHPGSLHLTNAMIEDILARDDAGAITRH